MFTGFCFFLLSRLRTICDPAGIRTQDPYIKSVMLYQLSYGILISALLYAAPYLILGVQI
ncbi:MAG: hypothetical protein JWO44_1874 [Bacteroidetes bacterium]|nr:hypothetical protein [Bacteroidota bacterium]